MIKAGCAVIASIILVVALSLGALVWGGVIKVGSTIIDREVVTNSQQYITSVNTALVRYKSDYETTTDPARQRSIVNQFCTEAAKIAPDQIAPQVYPFFVQHC